MRSICLLIAGLALLASYTPRAAGDPVVDTARPWRAVLRLDADRLLAVADHGELLLSRDGGRRWSAPDTGIAHLRHHFHHLARLGDGSLIIAGSEGLLALSDDDGASWSLLDVPYVGPLGQPTPQGPRGVTLPLANGRALHSDDLHGVRRVRIADWDAFERETNLDEAIARHSGWRWLSAPTALAVDRRVPLHPLTTSRGDL